MQQVEHLPGVQLRALAEPVRAVGLTGRRKVVPGGVGDIVLAAFRVGQSEPSHLQARIDVEAGLLGIGEHGLVGRDGELRIARILGQVRLLQPKKIVVGELGGEAMLDRQRLRVAAIVAQKKRERGARFNAGNDALRRRDPQQFEAMLLVAADARNADHHAHQPRQAGDRELLDADRHVGVEEVRIDLQSGL